MSTKTQNNGPKQNEQGGDKTSKVIGTRFYRALYDMVESLASPE